MAIIDRENFEAVQVEMARRAGKTNHPSKCTFSELSGIIRCGRCGAKFRKKVSGKGTKYAKVVWSCATYIYKGKNQCTAKQIPEDILKVKCAEVLGLTEYDPERFKENVVAVTVSVDGILLFTFRDGTEQSLNWQNPSRRERWTNDMKDIARKKAKEGYVDG